MVDPGWVFDTYTSYTCGCMWSGVIIEVDGKHRKRVRSAVAIPSRNGRKRTKSPLEDQGCPRGWDVWVDCLTVDYWMADVG